MTQTDCCAGQYGLALLQTVGLGDSALQLLFDFQVGIMNVTESWST